MLKIKRNIVDAITYLKTHKDETLTSVSKRFNIDRHTLSKYLDQDLSNIIYYDKEDCYILFELMEMSALAEYRDNLEVTLRDITEKYGYKNSSFVKKCDVLNIPIRKYKYYFNRNAFENIVTEEDAYILGFILADAYISDTRNELKIKLSARDEDILVKINTYLKSSVPIKHMLHNETKNELVELSLASKTLIDNLHKYRLYSGKSTKEYFYREIPNHLLRHYIRGIIDGDGYIRLDTSQIGCCGSKDVIEQIIFAFKNELHLDISVERYLKYDASSDIYRFWFCGEKARIIINYLYKDSNIYLDRKYNLAKKYFK